MFFHVNAFLQKSLLGAMVLLAPSSKSFAQKLVEGPTCVVPGLIYQYEFKEAAKDGDKVSACVQGGQFIGTGSSCIDDINMTIVRIQWNEEAVNASLTINSPKGGLTLNVHIVPPLQAGIIAAQAQSQTIDSGGMPSDISCTPALGGNCSPSYQYQWQESVDNVHWKDIKGAESEFLPFPRSVLRSTFYRRKVTEKKSTATAYSDYAVVYVKPSDG